MKSKELKVHNLPYDRQIEESVDAKPYFIFIILGILGFFICFVKGGMLLGIALIVICLASIFFLPRRVLIEFCNDYLVLYNRASHNECMIIYYEDIVSWNYIRGYSMDELEINLVDGTKESIEAFSKFIFESHMNNYVEEKKLKKNKKK